MSKSLAHIEAQIEKLKKEAAALRAKEVAEVVAKIRSAIQHYGLTPADLGFPESVRKTRASASTPTARAGKARPARRRSNRPIKYRDALGNTWVGHGKRPQWFVQALASGQTADDLLVKS